MIITDDFDEYKRLWTYRLLFGVSVSKERLTYPEYTLTVISIYSEGWSLNYSRTVRHGKA